MKHPNVLWNNKTKASKSVPAALWNWWKQCILNREIGIVSEHVYTSHLALPFIALLNPDNQEVLYCTRGHLSRVSLHIFHIQPTNNVITTSCFGREFMPSRCIFVNTCGCCHDVFKKHCLIMSFHNVRLTLQKCLWIRIYCITIEKRHLSYSFVCSCPSM